MLFDIADVEHCPNFFPLRAVCEAKYSLPEVTSIHPVSYTHLDVYKRQHTHVLNSITRLIMQIIFTFK